MSKPVENLDEFLDWLDSHPPLPRTPQTHLFMEPCGQFEGTDSCWFCGRPDAEHPRTVREEPTTLPEEPTQP